MSERGPERISNKTETKEPARRALVCDCEQFRPYLADANLSKEQEDEFLTTLWNIMLGFVDLGFGIHDVQQVIRPDDFSIDLSAILLGEVTESHSLSKDAFDRASDNQSGLSSERGE